MPYQGVIQTINFKEPITASLSSEAAIDDLERLGYVTTGDTSTFRIEVRINPDGIPKMEDFWQVTVPSEIANATAGTFRFTTASGS